MRIKKELLLPTLLLTLLAVWVMFLGPFGSFVVFVSRVFWPVFWIGDRLDWMVGRAAHFQMALGWLSILVPVIVIMLVILESYAISFVIAWLIARLKQLRR